MGWKALVEKVTERHPDVTPGKMFGMPLVEQAIG